ncbi:MAG TPA: hypothetical protein VH277_09090 [Gemmatimonadaceae bacterium]|jgi:hypothetical protein|nr:hypothetical protein [Gemmatimonadaceae bacterium]
MNTRLLVIVSRAVALPLASAARAQLPAPPTSAAVAPTPHAPSGPPIRKIASASALSQENLGTINSVIELRDGRVLVNDGVRRRLLLMDTTLTKVEVVLDSLSEIANSYGTRPGTLIPYRRDSVLFVDPASYAVVVLDPGAKLARVRSVWRVQDQYLFTSPSGAYGWPAVDVKGRIVYRLPAQPAPPKVAPPQGVPYIPADPDSAFVVAVDLDTRKLDTLATMRVPKQVLTIRMTPEGGFNFYSQINPLPLTDDWAVLADGTIAMLRGRDYRVEYLHPDGTWTSSAKLPFDWLRYTEEDKQKLIDSVRKQNERQLVSNYVNSLIRWVNIYDQKYPPNFKVPDGYAPQPGFMKTWKLPPDLKLPPNYIHGCAEGEEPTTDAPKAGATPAVAGAETRSATLSGAPGGPAGMPSCIPQPVMIPGNVPTMPTMREVSVIPAGELPDYKPPFSTNSVRSDMDGNLWVKTNPPKPISGGNVYDVISEQGELVDRLQLPPGYTIVGFGKGRVVYVSMRDAKGIHLARVRLK